MTKGLSQTLWIVIVIVVLLVVALVVLTIFGTSIGQFASIADAGNNCRIQATATCAATGQPPVTWTTTFRVGDQTTSCASLIGSNPCSGTQAEVQGVEGVKISDTPIDIGG